MGSRALSAPGPKKSKTESKKSQKRVKNSRFRLFFDSVLDFLGPGAGRARDPIFELYLQLLAQKGPNDPCSRAKDSKQSISFTGLSQDFGGILFICVSLAHKEWPPNRKTNFCHPPSPGTVPQIYLCCSGNLVLKCMSISFFTRASLVFEVFR